MHGTMNVKSLKCYYVGYRQILTLYNSGVFIMGWEGVLCPSQIMFWPNSLEAQGQDSCMTGGYQQSPHLLLFLLLQGSFAFTGFTYQLLRFF